MLTRTKKYNPRAAGRPRQITSELRALGVPDELMLARGCRKASLWLRPVNHLLILETAKASYRKQISGAHPDRGGDAELSIELNRAWRQVQKKFRANGYELGK